MARSSITIMSSEEQRRFYQGVLKTMAEARRATMLYPATPMVQPNVKSTQWALAFVSVTLLMGCLLLPWSRPAVSHILASHTPSLGLRHPSARSH